MDEAGRLFVGAAALLADVALPLSGAAAGLLLLELLLLAVAAVALRRLPTVTPPKSAARASSSDRGASDGLLLVLLVLAAGFDGLLGAVPNSCARASLSTILGLPADRTGCVLLVVRGDDPPELCMSGQANGKQGSHQ